jgi:hypothetical protein
MATDTPIPQDAFSQELRRVKDNPESIGSGSTVYTRDFYGNTETWVIETYRLDDGSDRVFIQRVDATGGTRFVLPAQVTATLARHRDQLTARSRRRAARRGLETRRLRGQAIGNPEALRRARARQGRQKGGAK